MGNQQGVNDATGVVSLADEEAVQRILGSTVLGLWELVNNLTRIKPSRARAEPKIATR